MAHELFSEREAIASLSRRSARMTLPDELGATAQYKQGTEAFDALLRGCSKTLVPLYELCMADSAFDCIHPLDAYRRIVRGFRAALVSPVAMTTSSLAWHAVPHVYAAMLAPSSPLTTPEEAVTDAQVRNMLAGKREPSLGMRRSLMKTWRTGDSAGAKVVRGAAWYARKRALRSAHYNSWDAFSTGLIGLVLGMQKAELSRGNRLTTYASFWVMHELNASWRPQNETITLSKYWWESYARFARAKRKLVAAGGSPDDMEAIRKSLGWSKEQFGHFLERIVPKIYTLDVQPFEDDGGHGGISFGVAHETLASPDGTKSRTTIFDYAGIKEDLDRLYEQMSALEKTVFHYRITDPNDEQLTLKQVGSIIGRSRERVRQIEEALILRFRARFSYLTGYH